MSILYLSVPVKYPQFIDLKIVPYIRKVGMNLCRERCTCNPFEGLKIVRYIRKVGEYLCRERLFPDLKISKSSATYVK